MKTEYEHLRYIRENYGDSAEGYYSDHPIYYFRLPGGVDTFLRGYIHKKEWHEKHRYWLEKANVNAEVICIEGLANIPYGKSLEVWWKENMGHYDKLMHESVNEGFRRFFMEIDARMVYGRYQRPGVASLYIPSNNCWWKCKIFSEFASPILR